MHGKAEDFLSIFVDHPLHLKRFLWHCVHATEVLPVASLPSPLYTSSKKSLEKDHGDSNMDKNLENKVQKRRAWNKKNRKFRLKSTSTLVWNTLLELCLRKDVAQRYRFRVDTLIRHFHIIDKLNVKHKHAAQVATLGQAGSVVSVVTNANDLVEQETLMLLEDEDASYDSDHAIVLMQQHGFTTGCFICTKKRKCITCFYNITWTWEEMLLTQSSKPNIHAKSSISANVLESETNHSGHRLTYFFHSNDERADDKLRQVLKCSR